MLGFDDYPELAERLGDVLGGHAPAPHVPVDRRTLLPITPVERPAAAGDVAVPGHAWVPRPARAPGCRTAPVAPLKLASGCDRRCAFCAIPSFRGSFVSRPPDDVVAEAAWLGMQGVRELVLVSENSTSYGKDLPGGTARARAAAAAARRTCRASTASGCRYLQPAEMRPDLLEAIATTPGRRAVLRPVVPARQPGRAAPDAPVRLARGLPRPVRADPRARARGRASAATSSSASPARPRTTSPSWRRSSPRRRLDAVGVFGYSDEDGTEAAGYDGKLPSEEIAARVARITALVEELMAQRAEDRVGTEVEVLVEAAEDEDFECTGRAAHQAPEVDGECVLERGSGLAVGDLVRAVVVGTEGADLLVSPRERLPRSQLAAAGAREPG